MNTKVIQSFALLAAMAAMALGPRCLAAGAQEGVALAIIYDTSGSMRDSVRDATGRDTPKYFIANRALIAVANQIQKFATNNSPAEPRKVQTALYVFDRGDSARAVVPMGPFDPEAIQNFARGFSRPSGMTPLGNALKIAAQAVLDSPMARKHVLIITDGVNTVGPSPAAVLPKLKAKDAGLSVHFVAFDVDAKLFDPVKRLGATVVAAADEKQLDAQLDYILQKKILLEDEEPKK